MTIFDTHMRLERKYSPDQDRDENGRFGSGGAGRASSAFGNFGSGGRTPGTPTQNLIDSHTKKISDTAKASGASHVESIHDGSGAINVEAHFPSSSDATKFTRSIYSLKTNQGIGQYYSSERKLTVVRYITSLASLQKHGA